VTFKAAPPQTFTVTPTAGAGGGISPATPFIVNSGAGASFTAAPATGFSVDQWSVNGALAQTGGVSYSLADVTADVTVHVTFKSAPPQTFTVTPTAGAGGAINPDAPFVVNSGAGANLTATPTTDFLVDQWLVNGALAQTGGVSFSLADVAADVTVHVSFKAAPPQTFTVTPTAGAGGSISPATPFVVNSGAGANFTATPPSGLLVDQWFVNGALAQTGGESFSLADVTTETLVLVTFKSDTASKFIPRNAGYTGMVSSSADKNYTYGRIRFYTTTSGAVTGNAFIDGHGYRFRGRLDAQGRLSRKLLFELNGKTYEHHLDVIMTNDGSGFSGKFKRDSGQVERAIFGERDAVGTHESPISQRGRYTAIVGNLPQSALGSPVRGFLSMRITPGGGVRIVGYLPDGTACSTGSHLSINENVAIVAGLYLGKHGYLFGQTALGASGESRSWTGELRWLKPLGATGVYGNGVLDGGESVVLDGALYRPPVDKTRILPAFDVSIGAATVTLSESDLPEESESIGVTITRSNKVIVAQTNTHKLRVNINPFTGRFRGSVVDAHGTRRTLRGAFVQGSMDAQRGEGFFVGSSQAGRVLIEPN
jgi:hypothetical protein